MDFSTLPALVVAANGKTLNVSTVVEMFVENSLPEVAASVVSQSLGEAHPRGTRGFGSNLGRKTLFQ